MVSSFWFSTDLHELVSSGYQTSFLHTSQYTAASIQLYDMPRIGESLIGWLDQERSIHVFLDPAPFFEFPTDFRIHQLQPMERGVAQEDIWSDNTLIVVPRKTAPLTLSIPIVETIRRLLSPLYEFVEDWRSSFGPGMRNALYPSANFT